MKTYEEQYRCCNNNATLVLTASQLFLPLLVFILPTAGSTQIKHTHALYFVLPAPNDACLFVTNGLPAHFSL